LFIRFYIKNIINIKNGHGERLDLMEKRGELSENSLSRN